MKNINISDELQLPNGESEVDVLKGMNHYLKLVTGSLVRHSFDDCLPEMMETVFGYILLGMSRPRYLKPESSSKEKVDCMYI